MLSSAAPPVSLKLVQTIPLPGVKGRFDHFSIDPKGKRLFVAALGNNSLEIVDLSAGKSLQSVPGMSKPTGILYLANSNQVQVANGGDGTLRLLDCSAFRVLRNLTRVADADNLRLDPKTQFVWLGYAEGALGSFEPNTLKLLGTIKIASHPESFQMETHGPRLFVNLPHTKQVGVIDREKFSVLETWPMEQFQGNFPMSLDESNKRLFVGCRQPPRLVILNTETGKMVADIAISSDTDDLFYDAKRKRVYISCGEGFIDIVEQASAEAYQRVAKIPTGAGARTSFFSADLDRYYLAVPGEGEQKAEIRVYQPE
jgi:DNA-binding beta-propeller fold protein YncE